MPHRCEVCDEVFNKSNHSPVKCPFCEFSSCTDCNERYLLETTQDAHCMSCRKGWTREVLVNNFTQKFVTKKYKERRENLLFEREKSMMPATQIYVEYEKECRKINKEIIKKREELHMLSRKIGITQGQDLAVIAVANELPNEFEALLIREKQVEVHRKEAAIIQVEIQSLEWMLNAYVRRITGNANIDIERRAFVRACPYANCKGFLSTAWKCGLCENWTCPTCHEVKGLEKDVPHTCDPNNVATAELLARDSRNCPKCAAMIFKINGCDQMWCTQCHTAFSWRTGRIETHTVHNPHYYEFMRSRGTLARQPGDVLCGGLPDWHHNFNRYINGVDTVTASLITNAYRSHGHAQYAILPRYAEADRRTENRDLRIQFMLGDINEDTFKKKIQQREKANERKRDIRQVVDMYMTVLVDLFQSFTVNRDANELIKALFGLRDHYNTTLEKVHFTYKCAVPTLYDNFNFRI